MITVLMATYNGSKFVIPQLESIRKQTVVPDRVIILDDCSTDDTVKIIEDYLKSHQLDTWMIEKNKTNLGHYKTFIALCRMVDTDSKYVFFSDQDDIWKDHKIETMLTAFSDENVSMAFCRSEFIDEHDQTTSSPKLFDSQSKATNRQFEVSLKTLLQSWPSGYQTAFRSNVLSDILSKNYDQNPSFQFHDVLFGMLAALYGKVICIDDILDSHRIHGHNVTLSSNSQSLNGSLENRLDYYEKMVLRYQLVRDVARLHQDVASEKVADNYISLYQSRIRFIKRINLQAIFSMIKLKSYYNGSRAIVGDMIYSFRLNSLIKRLVRRK